MINFIQTALKRLASDEGLLGLLAVIQGYINFSLFKIVMELQEKRLQDNIKVTTKMLETRAKVTTALSRIFDCLGLKDESN